MKNKEYISFKNQIIKLDQNSLKNLQSSEALFEVMYHLTTNQHFSYKKEKQLLQLLVDFHYDKKELHEKQFFDVLLLHTIRLNHFEVVQSLIKKTHPSLNLNTLTYGNKIWPKYMSSRTRIIDWKMQRQSLTPLAMAVCVNNNNMFKYIIEKSDFHFQLSKKVNFPFPLEYVTENLIASITSETFEKNEMLKLFVQNLFEKTPEKMEGFILYYEKHCQYYDLTETIRSIYHDNKVLNLEKIKAFPEQFVSFFEKKQLEHLLSEEKTVKKRMKI